MASLTACLAVASNAVTALELLVVNLSLGVTLTANATDQVVGREASAGSDDGIPDFVGLAG